MIHTRIADRYVLLAPIGSGGEARVFRALDETSTGEVAIRLALHDGTTAPTTPPDFSHANWVQLLDSGLDAQHGVFQVFELLEGDTLGTIVGTGWLARDDWRAFVDQSLDAVEAVHAVGAVHGDINADNFFWTASGWKLLELPFFRYDPPQGRSTMFGSIYTLAPEQINGAKPGIASDLYSLGCLYYYAASGNWPHTGATVQEVAIDCLIHPPVDLKETAGELPPAWSDWVMKLIAPQVKDRFSSVGAARQVLVDAVA